MHFENLDFGQYREMAEVGNKIFIYINSSKSTS